MNRLYKHPMEVEIAAPKLVEHSDRQVSDEHCRIGKEHIVALVKVIRSGMSENQKLNENLPDQLAALKGAENRTNDAEIDADYNIISVGKHATESNNEAAFESVQNAPMEICGPASTPTKRERLSAVSLNYYLYANLFPHLKILVCRAQGCGDGDGGVVGDKRVRLA